MGTTPSVSLPRLTPLSSSHFSPQALVANLPSDLSPSRYWVAFSGGMDSQVLLHALAAARNSLAACDIAVVHVNHGLSTQAGAWAAHCARVCDALSLPLTLLAVDAAALAGESPEAAARDARYAALAELMRPGDCLLTAHHQDYQAETLLLQLLRGAGPKGLAAMPGRGRFSQGWHARPLLNFRRDELRAYAESQGLQWQEDDSNGDMRFARNYLRREIMPALQRRFPGMATTLSRSARRCAEAAQILQAQARADLAALQLDADTLSVQGLRALGGVRARNLLHDWIGQRGLPVPAEVQLQALWDEVIWAGEDAEPLLCWPGVEARRYRDALCIMPPLSDLDVTCSHDWDMRTALELPGLGRLQAQTITAARGEAAVACDRLPAGPLRVGFRRGGERLCLPGRQGHHALKKLFQEAGIPPWRRGRLPLLFAGEQLMAVVGLWVDCAFAAREGQEAVLFTLGAQ